MKYNTTRFGVIDVDDSETIVFPSGLVGFPELTRFVVLDYDVASPFKWLQSLEAGEMAFVVTNPARFAPKYAPRVTEEDLEPLGMSSTDDPPLVFVVVTIPNDPQKMWANLRAPIIASARSRRGVQVVLREQHNTRHKILEGAK